MELNKKDVYNKTIEARKEKAKKDLEIIKVRINDAAAAGEMEVWIFNMTIEESVIGKLRESGFRIKISPEDMDDYGHYYQGFIKISWKPTLLDRIIRLLFGEDIRDGSKF